MARLQIPHQCRFPPMILSSGETLTELLVHKSLNEFADIIAYSLAQIDVSHNFVLSLHIANQLNGPQAVENPNQNRRTSEVAYPYPPGSAAVIGTVWSAVMSSNALKLAMTLAVALLETGAAATLFNYIANVFAGIFIVQFTQQVQTIEQVADPLAASGARVYLTPPDVN
ncbi:MAG: hypothetical protein EZS28_037639 [Streblomastix strix]|uniref:Uncharacterized protein n=1 Tax=Streblomastix strix TaxID=222440 RepID=A0A5J4U7I9_9EUKA|nr:MAG: hypothetical protein EZS28_037639 [Streblomastix strix]